MTNISTETILAQILGIKEEEIKAALASRNGYKIARVPKKSGGYRTLYIPPEPLKRVQKKILRLLQRIWKFRQYGLHGLYGGTSCANHAQTHDKAKWIFQVDLRDAFPSVNVCLLRKPLLREIRMELSLLEYTAYRYRDIIREIDKARMNPGRRTDPFVIHYLQKEAARIKKEVLASPFVAFSYLILFRDNYKENLTLWNLLSVEEAARKLADLIIELTTFQGILPQGTPTAPFLFYLALAEQRILDRIRRLFPEVSRNKYQFRVSAYVDNFVVSAQKPVPPEMQREIIRVIEECGFIVNRRKTRHQPVNSGSPIITGLRIFDNNGERRITLPQKTIRKWRGLIHRAIFEPELRLKVHGFVSSLKPIYGEHLPLQIEAPYKKLLLAKAKEEAQTN